MDAMKTFGSSVYVSDVSALLVSTTTSTRSVPSSTATAFSKWKRKSAKINCEQQLSSNECNSFNSEENLWYPTEYYVIRIFSANGCRWNNA